MAIEILTTENYQAKLDNSNKLALLDFWNSACGVCKNLAPIVEEIAAERDDIEVYSVHAEENPEIVSKFSVMTAPTLLFIADGKVKKRTIGFKSKASILEIIDNIIAAN